MKIYFSILFLLILQITCVSQNINDKRLGDEFKRTSNNKFLIDTSAYVSWPSIDYSAISNDGNYVLYNVGTHSSAARDSLFFIAPHSKWTFHLNNLIPSSTKFTSDSKFATFLKAGDTLGILPLGSSAIRLIPNVKSYKIPESGNGDWIAYEVNSPSAVLVLFDVASNEKRVFPKPLDYRFNNRGDLFVILSNEEDLKDSSNTEVIKCIDLKKKKSVVTIWRGEGNEGLYFDKTGDQIAFCSIHQGKRNHEIWYYKRGMSCAHETGTKGMSNTANEYYDLSEILSFSEDGSKIFVSLKKKRPNLEKKNDPQLVQVWSYMDKYLRPLKSANIFVDPSSKTLFCGVITIADDKLLLLDDSLINLNFGYSNNNFVLAQTQSYPDNFYNKDSRSEYYLISLNEVKRKLFKDKSFVFDLNLSPKEKFIVWFDPDSLNYFSFEIKTGKSRNLTASISIPFYDEEALKIGRIQNFGIAGWSETDDALFLYDRFDIWKVDPGGSNSPLNVTGGFGRKDRIVFGLFSNKKQGNIPIVNSQKTIYLTGFNPQNKHNGFFEVIRGRRKPTLLSMGPYCYYIPTASNHLPRTGSTGNVEFAFTETPMKARDVNKWLVTRMSSGESPNVFTTRDFIHFIPITDIYPEKQYNWLTAELVNWKSSTQKTLQGILYKPQNLDTSKKYPLIFTYYEKRSDELNQFLRPQFSQNRLDIATFVSNGYLVFVPDFDFKQGHNGESVLDGVVSATKYLSKFSWIDSARIGLQGHSFGGWITNYLITHSNLFSAACEASGASDLVSGYNQLLGFGESRHALYEVNLQGSPYGIGVTPWSNPELYIENSPIFFVDKINTPLLMMHGSLDRAVPFDQAIELFLAMKRAGKKVWLLQYISDGHSLGLESAKDFTNRMREFFDHYLKGTPPPKWMEEGIPEGKD